MIDSLTELSIYQKENMHLHALKENKEKERLLKVCREFEALFIKQMLNSMKKTVDKSGLIERGMSEEIFEDLLYDEYAKKISETANLGISTLLYRQLSESE